MLAVAAIVEKVPYTKGLNSGTTPTTVATVITPGTAYTRGSKREPLKRHRYIAPRYSTKASVVART